MRVLTFKTCGWMPVLLAALMLTGILSAYIWAVVRETVPAFVPFISDAGGSPPQSGIFGIFLFLSAFMGTITMIVRYFEVRQSATLNKAARYVNNGSVVLGFISLGGMLVVAAYPINTMRKQAGWELVVALPHTIGALCIFVVGVCYAICQTGITLLLRERFSNRRNTLILVAIRAAVCVIAIISVLFMTTYRSHDKHKSMNGTESSTITPSSTTTESSGGDWISSNEKMGNSIAEWVLAMMLIAFFLSLYPELSKVSLTADIEDNTGTNSSAQLHPSNEEPSVYQEYGAVTETQKF